MITLDSLKADRERITALGSQHGARNIRVFGSVARGENRADSDVDLLVDLDPGRTLFDLAGFVADLEDFLGGTHVDIVTPGGLRYLREKVMAEAVRL